MVMNASKTLLRVPELVKAVAPLVSVSITAKDIFRLIGTGGIKPLGFIQRVPVFDITQIGEVARKFPLNPNRITILGGKS